MNSNSPEERLLKIIFPKTVPRIIQDNRTLMAYDKDDNVLGCFFSLEECAEFFQCTKAKIRSVIYEKRKLYNTISLRWVKTGSGKKKTWHYNYGEVE